MTEYSIKQLRIGEDDLTQADADRAKLTLAKDGTVVHQVPALLALADAHSSFADDLSSLVRVYGAVRQGKSWQVASSQLANERVEGAIFNLHKVNAASGPIGALEATPPSEALVTLLVELSLIHHTAFEHCMLAAAAIRPGRPKVAGKSKPLADFERGGHPRRPGPRPAFGVDGAAVAAYLRDRKVDGHELDEWACIRALARETLRDNGKPAAPETAVTKLAKSLAKNLHRYRARSGSS